MMIWRTLLVVPLALATLWGVLALYYQLQLSGPLRWSIIIAWAIGATLLILGWQRTGAGWLALLMLIMAILMGVWWHSIKPSNYLDWAPDVARSTTGVVDGTRVTLKNVRNFDWQTRDQAIAHWETRVYDIDQIQTVDVYLSYWMGPAIAHTLVSFGFSDGQHVVWSVEIRREKTEKFSSVGGFFKEFEMSVVAADENDIIRLRTNIRHESVYLYRVSMPPAAARSLFLAYVDKANQVAVEPRFYNTAFANCTTIVYELVSRVVEGLPKDYRLLLSGYLPDYLYEIKALDTSQPLSILRAQAGITNKAQHIPEGVSYSEFIRTASP